MKQDFYKTLGLERNASVKQIKKAHRNLAKKYHPDLVDGQEVSKRFNKLDPTSAKAMPKTGNPHIDAKVEKAKNNPDKDGPAHRQNVFAKIKI